jgi:prepilin peptidase CpaA
MGTTVGLSLVQAGLWVAGLAALAAAAGSDLKSRIIPNRLVLVVAAAGLGIALTSWPDLLWMGAVAAIGLILGLGVLARFDWLGGGDVKLIAAASLLVRPDRIIALLLAIAVAGGVLSMIYLVAYWALKPGGAMAGRMSRIDAGHRALRDSIPYGIAILGGVGLYAASELYQCLFATSCSL